MSTIQLMLATGGSLYDTDAQAFISAVGTLTTAEKEAIDTLVIALKDAGIWSKRKAIYPFVGGTAAEHKWNLKDPRDLDAAFRLSYTGGMTHNADGMQFDGSTNQYADTHLVPSTELTLNSYSLAFYSRTINGLGLDLSSEAVYNTRISFLARLANGTQEVDAYDDGGSRVSVTEHNSKAFYSASRTSSSDHRAFRNGEQVGSTVTATGANGQPTNSFYIGRYRRTDNGLRNNKTFSYVGIGDGLTPAEILDEYEAVEAYQLELSRSNTEAYPNDSYGNHYGSRAFPNATAALAWTAGGGSSFAQETTDTFNGTTALRLNGGSVGAEIYADAFLSSATTNDIVTAKFKYKVITQPSAGFLKFEWYESSYIEKTMPSSNTTDWLDFEFSFKKASAAATFLVWGIDDATIIVDNLEVAIITT